ncbi:MAG: RdgB/HAM1 family non-canonical purine NTP pyrophosphatase [Nitriliruptoraceae bacterium]
MATANRGKLAEIRAILAPYHLDVELETMTELGVEPPVEDGDTFEDNALIKARQCVAATGLPAIADDSGLEVDALDGEPGVRSARYAGEPTDDDANNRKLLAALAGVPDERRTARFVCAAALVTPDGRERVVRGTMAGYIVDAPRGDHGFGYDPLFVSEVVGDGRTNAELTAQEKDAISHRGAAFRALAPALRELLLDG